MLAKDVKVGHLYIAKVSGKIVAVKILSKHPLRGWDAMSEVTSRFVRIATAGRLRREVVHREDGTWRFVSFSK